jgi:hypothetical protein
MADYSAPAGLRPMLPGAGHDFAIILLRHAMFESRATPCRQVQLATLESPVRITTRAYLDCAARCRRGLRCGRRRPSRVAPRGAPLCAESGRDHLRRWRIKNAFVLEETHHANR